MAFLGHSPPPPHHCSSLFRGEFFMGSLRTLSPPCPLQAPPPPPLTPSPPPSPNDLIAPSSCTKSDFVRRRTWQKRTMMMMMMMTPPVVCCKQESSSSSRVWWKSQLGDFPIITHGRRQHQRLLLKKKEEVLLVVRASQVSSSANHEEDSSSSSSRVWWKSQLGDLPNGDIKGFGTHHRRDDLPNCDIKGFGTHHHRDHVPDCDIQGFGTHHRDHLPNCDIKGFGRQHQRLKKKKKRELLVVVRASEVSSSANHSEEGEHIEVVLGREIRKRDLQVASTALAAIGLSVANKVLYKMALVPLNRYPFFLAQVNTFGYVVTYSTILLIRIRAGIVTKEMLGLPKVRFVALGALEALGIASGMAAAANISGASIPILHQLFLVWQLLLSTTILQKRYAGGQILGCLLVILGVLVVVTSRADGGVVDLHSLQWSGFIWPLIMIFSTACTAGASILKEFIFQDAAKQLQGGGTVDIFVVNSLGSAFQALFVLLLLPLLSNLKGIPFQQLPTYLWDGAACFLNKGGDVACAGAPLVPLLYILTNLAFNISNLSLLKQSSAVVSSLCGTLAVPLTIWSFTLPLPLLGTPASLPPRLFVGAAILIAGLASYNISGETQRRELNG